LNQTTYGRTRAYHFSQQLKTSKPPHTTKVLKDRVPNHMIADKSPNIKRKAFTPQAAFTGRGLAA